MIEIKDGKVDFLGKEFDWDDLRMKLDARMAGEIQSLEGDKVELFGKKLKISQISRRTLLKVAMLYVKAEKDVEGELVDNKSNRMIDIKCASLLLLDSVFGWKQKMFHWAYWRYMASNGKYNTYILQSVIRRVLNSPELLFFWSSVEYIKSTALERMKINRVRK